MRFSLVLALLLTLPLPGRAAPTPGRPLPPTLAPFGPVTFAGCPDTPQLAAVTSSLPPALWPAGAKWVITEYDEAAWPAAVAPYRAYGITTQNNGFMVYSKDPQGFRGIFLRRYAPDGTPVTRILWHELGHVVWPGLVDRQTHDVMSLSPILHFFGGGTFEWPGLDKTEEAFAVAFEANRFDRAHAGDDWGQLYIDSLFAAAPPPYEGKPIINPVIGGPILPEPE